MTLTRQQLPLRRPSQRHATTPKLARSVSRARRAAEALAGQLHDASHRAAFDALTRLPNGSLLLDRLSQADARARRNRSGFALLLIDLDRFKPINVSFGHAVGDAVLQLAARRLAGAVREVDMVGRLGGDTFLVLLADVGSATDALHVAHKLLAVLMQRAAAGDAAVPEISASIGVCLCPHQGADAQALIAQADAAMCCAKRAGGAAVVLHGDGAGACSTDDTAAGWNRRIAASPLRDANAQLVLAALTAQRLQADAERARAQQTELLAVVAHELRNPLAPIRYATELLQRRGDNDAASLQLQRLIDRQVRHMTRLIDDLLDLSRVTTGKLRIERAMLDMRDVVADAIGACGHAVAQRRQRIDAALPELPVWVHGDPARLLQVVSNLLDNASKYSPPLGTITVRLGTQGDQLMLAVIDTGIGIAPEALSQVFDPFMQHPVATDFDGSGLGLGLTVVRELVEAHGGQVVSSSAGHGLGSEFRVSLPLLRPDRPAAGAAPNGVDHG